MSIWELELKICSYEEEICDLKQKEKRSIQMLQKRKKELWAKDAIVEQLIKTG